MVLSLQGSHRDPRHFSGYPRLAFGKDRRRPQIRPAQRPQNLGFDESAQSAGILQIEPSQHDAVDVDDVCFTAYVFVHLKCEPNSVSVSSL
jgi:hypothetical protein